MPGQAIITINHKQWTVSVAATPEELVTGLGGVSSIPAGTGMLFDMGQEQTITVTTVPMLFPLDIVFLDGSLIVNGIALNVAPGYIVTTDAPARFFLELNAGEAVAVQKGQQATIQAIVDDSARGVVAAQTSAESLGNLAVSLFSFSLMIGVMTGLVKKGFSPSKPRVAILPRLPAEARGDFLFYEYIRDLVRMGESISDEEARMLWEDWQKARKK